jgi:hypothetical protein
MDVESLEEPAFTGTTLCLEAEPVDEASVERFTKLGFDMIMGARAMRQRRAAGDPQDPADPSLGQQILSTYPLVRVERYADDEGLEQAMGFLVDRRYHGPNGDASWEQISQGVRELQSVVRLRRVVTNGPLASGARGVLQRLITLFDARTGVPCPLALVHAPAPAFVNSLMFSSELVACHSLAANHAASKTTAAGQTISYTVRDIAAPVTGAAAGAGGAGGACGVGGAAPLMPIATFMYDVVAVFGFADGLKGRAILVRPKHMPNALYVCFRGVRRDSESCNDDDLAAARRDRATMANNGMYTPRWLKELAAEGHGRSEDQGERAHHHHLHCESVVAQAVRHAPLAELKVHRGVDEYARTVYAPGGVETGLREWLQTNLPPPSSGHRAGGRDETHGVPLCFIGFSLGGALAQLTALRVAHDCPHLAHRVHVLGLGACPWATARMAMLFRHTFGGRAAQLITAMAEPDHAPSSPSRPNGQQQEEEQQHPAHTADETSADELRRAWRIERDVPADLLLPASGLAPTSCLGQLAESTVTVESRMGDGGGDGSDDVAAALSTSMTESMTAPTLRLSSTADAARGSDRESDTNGSVPPQMPPPGAPASALLSFGGSHGVLVDPLSLGTHPKAVQLHNTLLLEVSDALPVEARAPWLHRLEHVSGSAHDEGRTDSSIHRRVEEGGGADGGSPRVEEGGAPDGGSPRVEEAGGATDGGSPLSGMRADVARGLRLSEARPLTLEATGANAGTSPALGRLTRHSSFAVALDEVVDEVQASDAVAANDTMRLPRSTCA